MERTHHDCHHCKIAGYLKLTKKYNKLECVSDFTGPDGSEEQKI